MPRRPTSPTAPLRRALALACAVALAAPAAVAQDDVRWIDTWSASPQGDWGADFFAPVGIPRSLRDQTLRQVARVSLGGPRLRVELTNEFGDQPLRIGAARVALAGPDGAIVPGSDRALTFAGDPGATIPPGAPLWSDPVDLAVEDLGSLAVSLYLPEVSPTTTWHNDARQTAYLAAGDQTAAERLEGAETLRSRIFFSGIAVEAEPEARSVVLFGDSITDGDSSTPDANRRWPDVLAERLVAAGIEASTLNEGISGARVLSDRMGQNALARFDRDVLGHPDVATVVVMMGINDIGWPDTPLVPEGERAPDVEAILAGYAQLIERARAHGVRVVGATLTPFENTFEGAPLSSYYDAEKEAKRQEVNAWIRGSGAYDAVIDFDAVLQDPANPKRLKAEYDSGDHLHPNDAGYAAMANAVAFETLGLAP